MWPFAICLICMPPALRPVALGLWACISDKSLMAKLQPLHVCIYVCMYVHMYVTIFPDTKCDQICQYHHIVMDTQKDAKVNICMHKLTIKVCIATNSSSICFYPSLFLKPVRNPHVLKWLYMAPFCLTKQITIWESPHDWLVKFAID